MTKQHSKALISGMILASLVLPTFAFAQDAGAPTLRERVAADGTGESRLSFCTQIDKIAERLSSSMGERETRNLTNRGERSTKLSERFEKRDTTRVGNRDDWDQKRDEWKTKLTERAAGDPVKLAAVDKFIAAIDAAVAKRRTAVDGAVASFRTAVDAEVKARQSAVDAAVAKFKSDTDAATTKAKADCAAQVTPRTVRESYVADMKAARETLKLTLKSLVKRDDALKVIGEARKKAVEVAVAEFKEAVKTATYDLKMAKKA